MSGFTLELPMPPSANHLWRHSRGRVHLSFPYRAWKTSADRHFLAVKRDCQPVHGLFDVHIVVDDKRFGRGDLDNKVKPLLDSLQRWNLIDDDKLCTGLRVEWGASPLGCRVTVTPVERDAAA
jgi:crossover junction endodeoxyribonuclease RusA